MNRYYWEALFSIEYFPYWEFTMLMMLCLSLSMLIRINRIEVFAFNKVALVLMKGSCGGVFWPLVYSVDHGEGYNGFVLVFDIG